MQNLDSTAGSPDTTRSNETTFTAAEEIALAIDALSDCGIHVGFGDAGDTVLDIIDPETGAGWLRELAAIIEKHVDASQVGILDGGPIVGSEGGE